MQLMNEYGRFCRYYYELVVSAVEFGIQARLITILGENRIS